MVRVFILLTLLLSRNLMALSVAHIYGEQAIPAPTLISPCQGKLWVKPLHHNELWGLNLQTLKIEKKSALPNGNYEVSAMTCFKDQLILAVVMKKSSEVKIIKGSSFISQNPSGIGIVKAIQVQGQSLYLLRNKLIQTDDLEEFQTHHLKTTKKWNPSEEKLRENPFADWQRKMPLSDGGYSSFVINKDQIYLADAILGNVVSAKLADNIDDYKIMSDWGVWEGSVLSPKGMSMLERDLIVADPGVKLIHRFDARGRFMDSYTVHSFDERFGYPFSLASQGKLLYVSDFFHSKIYALDLNVGEQLRSGIFRRNLLRHDAVSADYESARCLSCHNGNETLNLAPFSKEKTQHPINVMADKWDDKTHETHRERVSCSSCHDTHHVTHLDQNNQVLPSFLKKRKKELCLDCHQSHFDPLKNHYNEKSIKLANDCTRCHSVHGANAHMLTKDGAETCLQCHQKQRGKSSHPINEKSNCIDCHSPHQSSAENSWAKIRDHEAEGTCIRCHREEAAFLGMNKHLNIVPKNKVHWPKEERSCLSCHIPHDGKHSAEQRCLSCHKEESGHSHQRALSVAYAGRAEGLKLAPGNRMSCVTCHDPHRGHDGDKYIRAHDETRLQNLCASCHTGDMKQLILEFHPRFKKAKK